MICPKVCEYSQEVTLPVMSGPSSTRCPSSGFTLPQGSPQPLEGHLVLDGLDISGNVTSCEYSQTLGQIIGLAYAGAHQATPGMHIPIRVEGGAMVHAKVVQLPFHDPDNLRQEL